MVIHWEHKSVSSLKRNKSFPIESIQFLFAVCIPLKRSTVRSKSRMRPGHASFRSHPRGVSWKTPWLNSHSSGSVGILAAWPQGVGASVGVGARMRLGISGCACIPARDNKQHEHCPSSTTIISEYTQLHWQSKNGPQPPLP